MKIVTRAELPYQSMSVEIMHHFELTRILIHYLHLAILHQQQQRIVNL